jgi:tellurite methyltransferase
MAVPYPGPSPAYMFGGAAPRCGGSAASHSGTARTLPGVLRRIVGFAADDIGDWVALLECHHRQHVRHRPPFRMASWVKDAAERDRHIGTPLDCPLCDRCEIPAGLTVTRTTATWDERNMPDALRRAHRVGSATWGRLRVETGSLRFVARTDPLTDVIVAANSVQGIPPDVEHHVEPTGRTRFAIDFLAQRIGNTE